MTEQQIQTRLWIEQQYGKPLREPKQKRHSQQSRVKAERVSSVVAWLQSLYFGATRRQVVAHFRDLYGDCAPHSAGERLFYRDLRSVLDTGKFVERDGKIVRRARARAVFAE